LAESLLCAVLEVAFFAILVKITTLSAKVVLSAPFAISISVFSVREVFGLTVSWFGLDWLWDLGVRDGAGWSDVGIELSEEVTGGLVAAYEV
jgi:hypothetical protein